MPRCPAIGKCPFFSGAMPAMPASADTDREKYCFGDNRTCARWVMRTLLGPAAVPDDLMPDQLHRAKIIAAA